VRLIALDWQNALTALVNSIASTCVRLQYGIYNSVHSAFFERYSHDSDFTSSTSSTSTEEIHTLITLTSEIRRGVTGATHGGTLEVEEGDTRVLLPIVLKFAFVSEEIHRLEHEAHVYDILMSAGVRVSRVYGLFRDKNWHHDYESDVIALIMSHAGTSIEKSPQVTKEQRCVRLILDFQLCLAPLVNRLLRP